MVPAVPVVAAAAVVVGEAALCERELRAVALRVGERAKDAAYAELVGSGAEEGEAGGRNARAAKAALADATRFAHLCALEAAFVGTHRKLLAAASTAPPPPPPQSSQPSPPGLIRRCAPSGSETSRCHKQRRLQ